MTTEQSSQDHFKTLELMVKVDYYEMLLDYLDDHIPNLADVIAQFNENE